MNHTSRLAVYLCGSILGLTALGKIFALVHGSGLLAEPHPFLPGSFKIYIWLGILAELAAFAVLFFAGARAFLTACLGLSILFITYHLLEAGFQVAAPCPCLGGLFGHWKPLAQAESSLSFMLACGLGISAFLALFPVSAEKALVLPSQPFMLTSGLAIGLWLFFGTAIIWFWQGRILGGDENMEAAKSLQMLLHPEYASRMWNDQPPLLTWLGTLAFRWFGLSYTSGRIVAVLLGMTLPLTLAVYWAKAGLKWAVVPTVIMLWLILPSSFGAYMLEAPAYAVGIAALLPLILRGDGRWMMVISVLLAVLALSIKLTAAFALVVPFVWLWQKGWRKAVIWGLLVAVFTWFAAWLQPGWSWSAMSASHLELSKDAAAYRLSPLVYAHGWLICTLAVFSIAFRYLRKNLAPIMPWLVAALMALFIHLIHRPFWSYYSLHLMAPVAVIAGVGMVDLWQWLKTVDFPRWQRQFVGILVIVSCGLWIWQREGQLTAGYAIHNDINSCV